ncbi:UTP--glucose-1-phosphate uridylyltransferase GalU [Alphaproteobacteria bacterium]|jgi:UTP--glucose-1-phosphate uridylyltransferase|nr:UTP--glucose-1-phosphate uridylyltransferase GalU [Alphaproteobacteria bacterium]
MVQRIRKAVFPVGGLGTRFLPATKAMPKEMLPVVDKPLIQYAVEEALAAGIEQIIFVTGRGKSSIEDHFDFSYELQDTLLKRGKLDALTVATEMVNRSGSVAYVRQQEPAGLGHAVWSARHLVGDEPFAILLADDLVMSKQPCIGQLVDVYNETGGNALAVMDVPREHTERYGVLDVGADDGRLAEVKGLVEKPAPSVAPSTLSVIGRYVLLPEVFDILASQKKGAGGEIQLTDAMARMVGSAPFHGLRFEGTRFDCGDKIGFLEATLAHALSRDDLGGDVQALIDGYASLSARRQAG